MRLARQRKKLNSYVKAIHQKRRYGFSLYEAIARYEQYKDAPAGIDFAGRIPEDFCLETFQAWEDAVRDLQAAWKLCGMPGEHPLREMTISAVSYTHLDVYKRQIHHLALCESNERCQDCPGTFLNFRTTPTVEIGLTSRLEGVMEITSWKFCRGECPGAEQQDYDDVRWETVCVPHDWSIEGSFREDEAAGGSGGYLPTGIGWYRTTFAVEAPSGEAKVLSLIHISPCARWPLLFFASPACILNVVSPPA